MAGKYYAVRKGTVTGIFRTWEECKKNVHGYSSAEYKSFKTLEEAEAYMKGGTSTEEVTDTVPVYVDGSYNVATKEYACGVVLFHDGRTETFSKRFADPDRAEMRNVAGEIEGSMCAMNYCLEHDIRELTIYYDYAGVEHWCTGAWKANKEGTRAYRDYYEKVSQRVRIHFVKVKGHSGDKYNDMADKLAKQAIGLA